MENVVAVLEEQILHVPQVMRKALKYDHYKRVDLRREVKNTKMDQQICAVVPWPAIIGRLSQWHT